MSTPRGTWAAAAALAFAGAATAEPRIERFYGYAFDLQTDRYLYTELHRHRHEGERWIDGRIRYVGADGRELGSKVLDFRAHPHVPVYRLDLHADGYAEGIDQVAAGEVSLFKRSDGRGAPERQRVRVKPDAAAADSGFHAFLVSRFESLLRGETVSFAFIAAGNLDSYRFRARRVGETRFEGRPALQLRVEPDSLLRAFVDPLLLSYDPQARRLLEYRGMSNIHDPATGKPWQVRVSYFTQAPAGVPALPPLED